jgi:hypothetical protein
VDTLLMNGDEGKGMEVNEDGSVSVNVRIDAGDVVADEQELVKGVTLRCLLSRPFPPGF